MIPIISQLSLDKNGIYYSTTWAVIKIEDYGWKESNVGYHQR